ncbi:hypothetical protein THOM_2815 [Trachipleistophora hominis]|uniref:Uncharacterized protein n=1 Tax=Trachipleistophora hominis TaxID=72359 RepID=L7JTB1_TRAHO|nr:hypothetical protein THOM_2815 [Trachipleistophora hominis]
MGIYHLLLTFIFSLKIQLTSASNQPSTSTSLMLTEVTYEMTDRNSRTEFFNRYTYKYIEICYMYKEIKRILSVVDERHKILSTVFSINFFKTNVLEPNDCKLMFDCYVNFLIVLRDMKKTSAADEEFGKDRIQYWETNAKIYDIVAQFFSVLLFFIVSDRNSFEPMSDDQEFHDLSINMDAPDFEKEKGELMYADVKDMEKVDFMYKRLKDMVNDINNIIHSTGTVLWHNLSMLTKEAERFQNKSLHSGSTISYLKEELEFWKLEVRCGILKKNSHLWFNLFGATIQEITLQTPNPNVSESNNELVDNIYSRKQSEQSKKCKSKRRKNRSI